MGVKFTNNAKTTLSASVSTSATSVSVASSSGFPSLSGSDYFYATMVQQSDDTALEIVKVTAVSGTTWTVSRAQDNTSARAFASGDKIELRASAGVFIDLFAEKAPLANPTFTGNITIGSAEISETELEILDGATVTTDELNKLDGTTATAASLTYGKDLYDTGVTAAEFDYLDGVTANIQTQISAKMSEPSGFARGSIIIGDSSGNPANLAAGANGYVLKSDGTDISWAEDEKTTTTNFVKNAFTGDNSTTAFTLSQSPNSEDNLIVFIEGVFQNQGDYSLSGTTLTFDEAPATGRKIVAYHVKAAVSGANLNHDQFTASGSAAFTLSITPINENNTQVFIDGVYQQKTDYSVSGTTLTFDTAPASGAIVEVMTFTQTEINVPTTGSVVTASIANDVNLNGNPTTTTQSAGNNSTRIATTAFVETAVSNLIDSAPGTMNTLNEIAAALGDDPSFTTTVNNAIATKLPLSGGTMTGNIAHASDFTIDAGGDIILDADGGDIILKDGGTTMGGFVFSPTSSDIELDSLGNFTLDVAGDIILDADGADVLFKDGGTQYGRIGKGGGSDLIINASIADKDIFFSGTDGSTAIDALVLDMSAAGKALFNSGAAFNGNVDYADNAKIVVGSGDDLQIYHDGSDSYITDTGTGNLLIQYSDLYFSKDAGSTHSVVFRSTGNVGIGTTSPAHNLHVVSSGNAEFEVERSSGAAVFTQAQSALGLTGTSSNHDFGLLTNGSVRMRIDTNGRVLIGNSSNIAHANFDDLQVGNGSSSNGITVYSGTGEYGSVSFADGTSGTAQYSGLIEYYHNDNSMRFYTNGSSRMRLTSSGHVIAPNLNQTGSTSNRYPLYWVHTGTTGSIEPYTGSIRAMKTDIADMGSVDWIHSLTPRSFKFRDYTTDSEGNRTYLETTKNLPNTEYGLIAEEVDEVTGSDYILDKDDDDNVNGVLYHNLVPILLKSVQELKIELDAAKARIEKLES